jgi:nanoRNase/pAp phosphatase (c-di-AMP/oligoRNAs hydrolase)
MNDNTKNYLGWALIVGVLVLAFAAFSASVAFSRASEPATYRSFAVSGQGRAIGVPDVAQFSFRARDARKYNLAIIAGQLGGGGHAVAAGAIVAGMWPEIKAKVVMAVQAARGV